MKKIYEEWLQHDSWKDYEFAYLLCEQEPKEYALSIRNSASSFTCSSAILEPRRHPQEVNKLLKKIQTWQMDRKCPFIYMDKALSLNMDIPQELLEQGLALLVSQAKVEPKLLEKYRFLNSKIPENVRKELLEQPDLRKKNKETLHPKEKKSYLLIIGALIELYWNEYVKTHPGLPDKKLNQRLIHDEISHKYQDVKKFVKEKTLQRKFKEALDALDELKNP